MISVLILTKNEEKDILRCLESVSWSDDIHVFDSFSTDNTLQIVRQAGASITQRVFDGYASQRNAALTMLTYKYQWVLVLDADEIVPEFLVKEMYNSIQNAPAGVNGFRIRRRDFLWNTWLKHAQVSPYYTRLIKLGKAHYSREINEIVEINGEIRDIPGYFDHYPFSKGISHWLNKHNVYSSMEADRWVEENSSKTDFSLRKAVFDKDFSRRRYHQKGLFYKIPGRPVIKWFYIVFWRLAFLDGRAGLIYAALQSIYEYFIVLKTRELLNKNKL